MSTSTGPGPHVTRDIGGATGRILCAPDMRDQLCNVCAALNLDVLAERRWTPERGNYVLELGTTAHLVSSPCPLCQLFASISPAPAQVPYSQAVHLRAFSACREFAGWYTPRNMSTTDSTLLGVVSYIGRDMDESKLSLVYPIESMLSSWKHSGLLMIESADEANTTDRRSAFSVRFIDPDHFNMDIARDWQSYCRANHTLTCGLPKQSRPKDIRLIDCETLRIVQPTTWVEYACLSYVWGTQTAHQEAPSAVYDVLSTYPKTIEDSISVARTLDIHYLWVDRYCIDQSSVGDRHHQIRQMDAIYRCAALTIIAAAGNGPDHGLPGANGITRVKQQVLRLGNRLLVHLLPHPSSLLARSTWATRGWTYQEGLLSRRRLIFTEYQTLYECDGMNCRENVTLPLDEMHITTKQRFEAEVPPGSFTAKRPGRYPLMFMKHAADYYQRQLSYPSDALNAMQGIFKAFQTQPQKRIVLNISGLPILPPRTQGVAVQTPLHSFLISLFWYHLEPGQRRRELPSWTWAGWQGGSISPGHFLSLNETTSVLSPHIQVWIEDKLQLLLTLANVLSRQDATSLLQEAYFIHLETWTTPCTLVYLSQAELPHWIDAPGLYASFPLGDNAIGYARLSTSSSHDRPESEQPLHHPTQCLGLILPFAMHSTIYTWAERWASMLVVEDKGEHFERLGVCHLYSQPVKWTGFGDRRCECFCKRSPDNYEHLKFMPGWEGESPRALRRVRLG